LHTFGLKQLNNILSYTVGRIKLINAVDRWRWNRKGIDSELNLKFLSTNYIF